MSTHERAPAPETDEHRPSSSEPEGASSGLQSLKGMSYADQLAALSPNGGTLIAGAGTPLPYATTIQRSFGKHDISSLRAHVGKEADHARHVFGAEAFAHGDTIVLGPSPSLHLVAHEAAHAIQQRAQGVGVDGQSTAHEAHADAVADRVVAGQSAEALLDEYGGDGAGPSTPTVQRRKATDAEKKRLAKNVERAMADANTHRGIKYPGPGDPNGLAPTSHWKKLGAFRFALRTGKSASEGIDVLFNGPTLLDCESTSVAVHMRAVRDTIKKDAFDQRYGQKGKKNQDLIISVTRPKSLSSASELYEGGIDGGFVKKGAYQKGDRAYFSNHPMYSLRHPHGAWSGEWAVYQGNKKWAGFGLKDKTEREMKTVMMAEYNKAATFVPTRDAKIKQVVSQLTKLGASVAAVADAKAGLIAFYKAAPAKIGRADVPGLDGDPLKRTATYYRIETLKRDAMLRVHVACEQARQSGASAAEVEQIRSNIHTETEEQEAKLLSELEAHNNDKNRKGKTRVFRLDADKVMSLEPPKGSKPAP